MTTDERLDRLAVRHEALTQSLELLARQVQEVTQLVTDVAEGTARLLNIAEIHERRISRLEGTD